MNQIVSKIIDLNKTNDVIVYPSKQTAKYNLLFFHGDVQVSLFLFFNIRQENPVKLKIVGKIDKIYSC